MIPYIPCETARELLERFIDGELQTAEQVAIQAHLRSCQTCAAHVDDLSLIGWAVRAAAPPAGAAEDTRALAVIQSGVLTRIRAERAQSWSTCIADLFADRRLLWPALGATAAVVLCLAVAVNVWRLTTAVRHPESLAAMLHVLGNPGSDSNPLHLRRGVSVPRVLDEGLALDRIAEDEAVYAFAAIVTSQGRVGRAELLDNGYPAPAASKATEEEAVLHAFKESRFSPAQVANGRRVAVMAVFLFAQTTVKEPAVRLEPGSATVRRSTPPTEPRLRPAPEGGSRSSLPQRSSTA